MGLNRFTIVDDQQQTGMAQFLKNIVQIGGTLAFLAVGMVN